MITLHRLGHQVEPFQLNPDLILTVEANPDTVITLITGAKIIVAESPERVASAVKSLRVEILTSALRRDSGSGPTAVVPGRTVRMTRDPRTSGSVPPAAALTPRPPAPGDEPAV